MYSVGGINSFLSGYELIYHRLHRLTQIHESNNQRNNSSICVNLRNLW